MLIGELSARTGVSPRLLRYYEQQGLLASTRDGSGYRTYDEAALTTVRQIRALLASGLPTAAIRKVLPCASGSRPHLDLCPEVVTTLNRELAAMDERIDCLRQARGALASYLRQATAVPGDRQSG